jgi:beta-hydroxylase
MNSVTGTARPFGFIPFKPAIRRAMRKSGELLVRAFAKAVTYTRYGKVTFYPLDQLPWTKDLEANWQTIRKELDAVRANLAEVPNAQDAYAGQESLTQDDQWKTFTIYSGYQTPHPTHSPRVPETTKILARIPNLTHAMFSFLGPGKHLAAHCGPYAGVLNCHLGLLIPPNPSDCRIRVGQDLRSWQEGKMLVFDETQEHEVWNDSKHVRGVLIIYAVRPLPFPLSAMNRVVMRLATWLM